MRSLLLLSMLGVAGATFVRPTPAQACGGTFCDAGPIVRDPQAALVDQTGETILFVVREDSVEAHIQIEYDPETEAAAFAWIIPVFGTPEVDVGSQPLFLRLLNSTAPSYGFQRVQLPCGGGGGGFDDGFGSCGMSTAAASNAGDETGGGGDDGGSTGGGTEVVLQEAVGAFDVVVLDAPSAESLMMWLGENEYYQDPASEPILQEYVDEGAQFVAVRLTQGAGISEIHPLVIRYKGTEACIPIRLTRIAAQDDMDIRAFFLGDMRVAPSNWRHVVLNPAEIDYLQFAANYKEVVSLAVDSPMADGHAWVTEYAGVSDVVPTDGLWSELWDSEPFKSAEPQDVVALLQQQGLIACGAGTCEFLHPLVYGLLAQWLPAPEGVPQQEFWSCVECYADQIDQGAWQSRAFADALQARIIVPAANAVDLVQTYPYLTRMYTTISPHEMTEDPLFWENASLEDVSNAPQIAVETTPCGGAPYYDLPNGWTIDGDFSGTWPDVAPNEMPAALRIEDTTAAGAPIVLVDNEQLIQDLLTGWNQTHIGADRGPLASCHGEGSTSGTGDTEGLGAAGSGDGCACRASRDAAPSTWCALVVLGALRRRFTTRGRRPRRR